MCPTHDLLARVGMWADVTALRQGDGNLVATSIMVQPPEVRLKGPVDERPADAPVEYWKIVGQTIAVTDATRLSERGGPVEEGKWVELFASQTVSETITSGLTALRMRGIEPLPRSMYGAIEQFNLPEALLNAATPTLEDVEALEAAPWIVSTIPVSVTRETMIVGKPKAGVLAHVAAELLPDGTLVAKRLKVEWLEPGQVRQPVQFTGVIRVLPEPGLTGEWKVGDRTVIVSDKTAINQEKGQAVVGARARVGLGDWRQDHRSTDHCLAGRT